MGGFARRTSYWSAFAKKYAGRPFLKLDGGSLFSNSTAESPIMNRWMLEGTYKSNLDAINLSTWDVPVWREMADMASAGQIPGQWLRQPLVSANVKPKISNFPAIRRYIILQVPVGAKKRKIVRVGITGLMFDPEERVSRTEFDVTDPDQAAAEVMRELQDKTDYRVILSDYTIGRAISLALKVSGISLLLVSHDYAVASDAEQVGDTLVAIPVNESRMLSEVRIGVDLTASKFNVQTRHVPLDRSIPDDPAMAVLQGKALAEIEEFRKGLK
jgi:hypothetical protein